MDSGTDFIVETHKERFPKYNCICSQRIYHITMDICY